MTSDADRRYSGSCLCGAVDYAFAGDPLLVAICHCTHCQKQSGGAFSVVAVVPAPAFEQHGDTMVFADRGDSGDPVYRHFCGQCGTPIKSLIAALGDHVIVKAGSLDQRQQLVPTMEVYCGSALPWVPAIAGTTRYDGSNV